MTSPWLRVWSQSYVWRMSSLGGAPAWGALSASWGLGAVAGGIVALRVRPRQPLVATDLLLAGLALPHYRPAPSSVTVTVTVTEAAARARDAAAVRARRPARPDPRRRGGRDSQLHRPVRHPSGPPPAVILTAM
jgi:hypothetical protein